MCLKKTCFDISALECVSKIPEYAISGVAAPFLRHKARLSAARVCLKNSLIRNFGVFSAISASSILDLALLSLRIYSLN